MATVEHCRSKRESPTKLPKALGLSREKVDELLANPFLTIPDRIARRCERFLKKRSGWMDEQHFESDPICNAFPEDMRWGRRFISSVASFETFLKECSIYLWLGIYFGCFIFFFNLFRNSFGTLPPSFSALCTIFRFIPRLANANLGLGRSTRAGFRAA